MRRPVNRPTDRSDPDVLKAAAERLLQVRGAGGTDEADDLEAWAGSDERRRAALDAVQAADEALARYGADDELAAMRRSALRARPGRRMAPAALAAGLAAAVLLGGGWWMAGQGPDLFGALAGTEAQTARYVTVAGERATVTLADGSVITLNADSAVDTAYDRRSRTVRLIRGQALFTVAHDPSRPFEVLADGRRVTAVGTAFDVLLIPEGLRVAMLDGVTRVSGGASGSDQTLSAGEVMTAPHDGPVTVRKVDTRRLAGWREGVVYFEETPLREAVAEMNRYARTPIVVADDRAGGLRVSGAFRVSEADAFADAMAEIFQLSVKHSEGGQTVLTSAKT